MKPLRDEPQPALRELMELLSVAEAHRASPFSKRQVQARLTRSLQAPAGRRKLRPLLLVVAGALIVASAAAAYRWLEPGVPTVTVVSSAASPPPARESRALPALPVVSAPEPVVSAVPVAPRASSVPRDTKRPAGEDPAMVAEAVRALRKQGNPARAQVLLDQYLKDHPRGVLAEDALALAIEAAAARKDPVAAELGRRYLARYPNGRFRTVAERALAR